MTAVPDRDAAFSFFADALDEVMTLCAEMSAGVAPALSAEATLDAVREARHALQLDDRMRQHLHALATIAAGLADGDAPSAVRARVTLETVASGFGAAMGLTPVASGRAAEANDEPGLELF